MHHISNRTVSLTSKYVFILSDPNKITTHLSVVDISENTCFFYQHLDDTELVLTIADFFSGCLGNISDHLDDC